LKNCRIYFGPFYIDPRISIFIMQPSGTGKSVAYDMINDIGIAAGIKMNDMGEATDAALVGTVEPEEVIDEDTGKKTFVYNTKPGLLSSTDILHYDEGKMLVTGRNQYAGNTLAWLQKALNPIASGQNQCTKNLAHGDPIEFYPTCSLLITSHDIHNMMEQILDTGFFQRIVLYPRYIPISDREQNELLRSSNFGKTFNTEMDIKTLSDELNRIGEKYVDWKITVSEKCYPLIRLEIDNLYKQVEKSHERVREIMATFVPRYNNLMYIFAFHHSAAEFKDIIDIDDIRYGADLMKRLFNEVLSWIEENVALSNMSSKEQTIYNSMVQIFNAMERSPDGYVMKVSLMKNCNTKWGLSMNTISRYMEKFKGFRKMTEIKSGNIVMCKLSLPEVKK